MNRYTDMTYDQDLHLDADGDLCKWEDVKKLIVPPTSSLCLECKEVQTNGYLCQACAQKYVAESPHIAKLKAQLDALADCFYAGTRREVAKLGYALDKLMHDKDTSVVEEVARQGHRLDVLVKHESEFVRAVVAEMGYGLDELEDDIHALVRARVETYREKQNDTGMC